MKQSFLTIINDVCEKIVILLFFALLLVNAVSNYFIEIGTGVLVIAVYFLICLYIFVGYSYKKRHVNKLSLILFLFFYAFITQFIWKGGIIHGTVLGNFNYFFFHLFSYVPLVFTAILLFEKANDTTIKYLRIIFIALMLVVYGHSIIILNADPTASRFTATGDSLRYPILLDYGHVYSIAIIFPYMIAWCLDAKPSKRNWIFLVLKLCFLGLSVYLIYLASFLFAILTIVISIFVLCLANIKNKLIKFFIPVGVVLLMILMLATGWMQDLLIWLSHVIKSNTISGKLAYLAEFLSTGKHEGSTVRFTMYWTDFINFLKHPIFGNIVYDNSFKISGHSTILDLLCGYGIVITTLFIMFYVNILRANLQHDSSIKKSASIASFVAVIFVALVNPIMSSSSITVFYILGSIIFLGGAKRYEPVLLKDVDFKPIKIAHVNMFVNGSTGKIMLGIADKAREQGHIVETYSTHVFSVKYKKLPKAPKGHRYYGNYLDNAVHFGLSHYFGKNGTHSWWSTWGLIRELKMFNPDIIHLHNLHSFCINLPMLFRYIKSHDLKVVWTLHDCWAFTGHCPHFDMSKCEKWRVGCSDCPSHLEYPKSLKDTSKWQYEHKKKWFTGIDNMTIVTPSKWLARKVKESFLKEYPVKVINNGIDLSVFKPTESDLREKYDLQDKFVLLFVADAWSPKKGLGDVIKLSKLIGDEYKIVMIGLSEEQISKIGGDILGLTRTDSVEELVKWYSTADVFVNTTMEDTFPTVNMEALACGTPIVTYKTGGSPEIVDDTCGLIVKKYAINDLKESIIKICEEKPFTSEDCVNRAKVFDKDDKFSKYVELYKEVH